MGKYASKSQWLPPEINQSHSGTSVDYHKVSARVDLDYHMECCTPGMRVTVDCDTLYTMLREQYGKGYRMIHLSRSPGELKSANQCAQIILQAFFRKSAEVRTRGRYREPITWKLHVEKSWLQTYIHYADRMSKQSRVVHTNNLVQSIARNTQNGERLISVFVTGQFEPSNQALSMSPYLGVDLFFEIPSPSPPERYMYKIALVPVRAEFRHSTALSFPDIACDWTTNLTQFLSEGWRLIDIYLDLPMVEQLRTPPNLRPRLCRPTTTDALWILEKPVSHRNDHTPLYEGTIVEHTVQVTLTSWGAQSKPDWDHVIRRMGSRGWELTCILESRSCNHLSHSAKELKSLFFFQRPLQ
ncbi:hypothetical protein BaRGS_00037605 [Batillaria attramentaria]|uniref:Uncharacterized protein n=1 Tax=Batillaria attramentaria TaxID=370345 RepID=A0ABD0J8M4_9CAEN